MRKFMRTVLVAFLFGVLTVAAIDAATTKFTDIQTRDATVTRDLTVNRTLSVPTGVPLPVVNIVTTTPTVAGVMVRTSAYVVYISTATTGVADWIKVGGQ